DGDKSSFGILIGRERRSDTTSLTLNKEIVIEEVESLSLSLNIYTGIPEFPRGTLTRTIYRDEILLPDIAWIKYHSFRGDH
ncbi:hypothetical protein AVEN_173691-1, partial [Araneus ventricosus]